MRIRSFALTATGEHERIRSTDLAPKGDHPYGREHPFSPMRVTPVWRLPK